MGFLAQNSQNIFQMIANNFRAFVWILIIGAIAVARVAKFLKEQNEARLRAEARKRAEQEALRTGRALDMPQPAPTTSASLPADSDNKTAAQRLEELAAQRRAQVEELRRRRAAATAGSGESTRATPSAPPPAPARAPAPPVRRAPTPPPTAPGRVYPQSQQTTGTSAPPGQVYPKSQQSTATTAPSGRVYPKSQETTGTNPRPARERPQVVRKNPPPAPTPVPIEIDPGESVVHRLVKESPAPAETKRREALSRPAKSEWRRALMYREILSPPLSLRDDA